jgi:hypothetical protein
MKRPRSTDRLQATLSSSAVACGGHRSVRVSHYTSRSVTLAQGRRCPSRPPPTVRQRESNHRHGLDETASKHRSMLPGCLLILQTVDKSLKAIIRRSAVNSKQGFMVVEHHVNTMRRFRRIKANVDARHDPRRQSDNAKAIIDMADLSESVITHHGR